MFNVTWFCSHVSDQRSAIVLISEVAALLTACMVCALCRRWSTKLDSTCPKPSARRAASGFTASRCFHFPFPVPSASPKCTASDVVIVRNYRQGAEMHRSMLYAFTDDGTRSHRCSHHCHVGQWPAFLTGLCRGVGWLAGCTLPVQCNTIGCQRVCPCITCLDDSSSSCIATATLVRCQRANLGVTLRCRHRTWRSRRGCCCGPWSSTTCAR